MPARGAVRRTGAVGLTGLLLAPLLVLTGPPARAVPPAADPGSRLVPIAGDMATLAGVDRYALSPQLARLLGAPSLDLAGLGEPPATVRTADEPTPPVGTQRLWPAIDAARPGLVGLYLKLYTLRAVGQKIEVWVASGCDALSCGTAFPAGDCRNSVPDSTEVTDRQIADLVGEFDRRMYPAETATFSTPPDHNGSLSLPPLAAAGLDFGGAGAHTVTLIDNVRDPNFYEFPKNKTYIAGFFAPVINRLTDRNVMTIDAFDWIHRTGVSPADQPDTDLCRSRPARARAYEGVFAHEWQHLLQSYRDPAEDTWVNEGLSDFAISLVGYGDPRRNVHQPGAQSHIFCFQGFGLVAGPANPNPYACGGPENSLTAWGDEGGGSELLADYGNVWSFMLFLHDRYGTKFISALHSDSKHHGLAGVQAQLDTFAPGTKVADVLHDFQLMNLVDHYAKAKGARVSGVPVARVTTPSLDATLNLDNPAGWEKPGAAPNGADYLALRGSGGPLSGSGLASVEFVGARTVGVGSAVTDVPVQNWFFSLVGIDPVRDRVLIKSFDNAFGVTADAATLQSLRDYPTVVAVVAHDDTAADASSGMYAGYRLTVNGVLQPGG